MDGRPRHFVSVSLEPVLKYECGVRKGTGVLVSVVWHWAEWGIKHNGGTMYGEMILENDHCNNACCLDLMLWH